MYIDLSILEQFDKSAIHCETEDQAIKLFHSLTKSHPELFLNWKGNGTRWSWYGSNTCYALHLYDDDFESYMRIQFSPRNFWERHGYDIVLFEDLIRVEDFGSIDIDKDQLVNLFNEIGV